MRFLLIFLFLATPVAACEASFRAGMRAFDAADRALTATEDALYRGLGWVSRGRVLDRLENLSATTTACEEIARLRDDLARATRFLERARAQFTLARSLCPGENRRRAEANLDALGDTAAAIAVQATYLADLAERC
ncbi:MAG: hypothetical protein Kow0013_22560 [Pararhodobacter sp.]